MFGYVYLVRNKVNDKQYIGQKHSEVFDPSYYGSGVYLQRALEKYGIENFEHVKILEWCETKEDLDTAERYWIDFYNAVESDKFYNLAKGGIGTTAGSRRSDSFKEKIAIATSKRIWTAEARENAAKATRGRVWIHKGDQSKLTTTTIADDLVLKEGWSYGRPPMSEEKRKSYRIPHPGALGKKPPLYGKHLSEESKRKISESLKDPEMQRHLSSVRKNRIWIHKDGINRTVKNYELNIYLADGWVEGMIKTRKKSSTTIES